MRLRISLETEKSCGSPVMCGAHSLCCSAGIPLALLVILSFQQWEVLIMGTLHSQQKKIIQSLTVSLSLFRFLSSVSVCLSFSLSFSLFSFVYIHYPLRKCASFFIHVHVIEQ